MLVTISGKQHVISQDTLTIDDAIDERSTAAFAVIDNGGTLTFRKGEPVVIWDGAGFRAFSGVVDKPERIKVAANTFFHRIECVDNHYYADKRILRKAYEEMTAGAIVRDIVAEILSDEGIAADYTAAEIYYLQSQLPYPFAHGDVVTVHDGPVIKEAVFNYVPVTDALQKLAELAGFWWRIDHFKRLWFVDRANNRVPFTVTGLDMQKGSVSVADSNAKYRNRQYVKGGKTTTDPQVEVRRGDGTTQAFALGFPVGRVPTVEIAVNGGPWISQTVGIKGLDEDKDWYWSKGDPIIAQDFLTSPLTSDDQLRVTYQGEFSVVTITQDSSEIVRLQNMQGGSGIVEDVSDEPDRGSRDAAFQSANAKLAKYGKIGRRLKFRTRRHGLEPGKLLTVDLPDYMLHEDMLIESISISTEGTVIWYDVSCVEGVTEGSWTKLFADLAAQARLPVIRQNIGEREILIILEQFSDDITWTEQTDVAVFACPVPADTLFPDTTLYPC